MAVWVGRQRDALWCRSEFSVKTECDPSFTTELQDTLIINMSLLTTFRRLSGNVFCDLKNTKHNSRVHTFLEEQSWVIDV